MDTLAFAQVVDCLSQSHIQLLEASKAQESEETLLGHAGRILQFSLIAQQLLILNSDGKKASN